MQAPKIYETLNPIVARGNFLYDSEARLAREMNREASWTSSTVKRAIGLLQKGYELSMCATTKEFPSGAQALRKLVFLNFPAADGRT